MEHAILESAFGPLIFLIVQGALLFGVALVLHAGITLFKWFRGVGQ